MGTVQLGPAGAKAVGGDVAEEQAAERLGGQGRPTHLKEFIHG